jgi:hypothetical protein
MKVHSPKLTSETLAKHERKKHDLLKKYPGSQKGYWKILGEDQNCDLGGSHHMPELCVVEATYEEAIDYALNMSGFWSWGGGGDIVEVIIKKPMDLGKRMALESELERLEKRIKEIKKELF